MILGFRDKRTAAFAAGEFIRAFQGFEKQAYKRLEILAAATTSTICAAFPAIAWRH